MFSSTLVLLLEDKWFRRRDGYDVLVWDNVRKLPWGFAAVFSLLAGYLAGGVPGMSQVSTFRHAHDFIDMELHRLGTLAHVGFCLSYT